MENKMTFMTPSRKLYRRAITLSLVLCGFYSQLVLAGKVFFRYENVEGVTVIDDHVPPEYAKRGYTILTDTGRIIEIVPRELTIEERKGLNTEEVRRRLEEEELERQRRYDRALLRRYSTINDIEAAELRKVNEIKVRMSILRGNIAGMSRQLEGFQEEAATLERDGRKVSDALMENMKALREEIAESERRMALREEELVKLKARFSADIARFRELLRMRGVG